MSVPSTVVVEAYYSIPQVSNYRWDHKSQYNWFYLHHQLNFFDGNPPSHYIQLHNAVIEIFQSGPKWWIDQPTDWHAIHKVTLLVWLKINHMKHCGSYIAHSDPIHSERLKDSYHGMNYMVKSQMLSSFVQLLTLITFRTYWPVPECSLFELNPLKCSCVWMEFNSGHSGLPIHITG